jgi:hypothetical protein
MPLAIALAVLIASLWFLPTDHQDKLVSFHQRCTAQGGIVLDSYKPNGTTWIGCYKGVTEIPNEGE